MRLAKHLAHAGIASRRASERLIAEGQVTVNGEVVTDPARDVTDSDAITVDGRAIRQERREVWVLNKPPGVVSTARDPGRRTTVTELVESKLRLYPVGRLDADTTGLILLTNDGELANRLMHPRYGVAKTYRVRLERPPTERQVERLRHGVRLDEGPTAPAQVRRRGERTLEVTLREGRKRQVKRMVERVGNRVVELRRIRFGPLHLGQLPEGKARRLSRSEVKALWEDSGAMPERGR